MRLCFGTFARVLKHCKMSTNSQNKLVSVILHSVDANCRIDDGKDWDNAVYSLLNCKTGLPNGKKMPGATATRSTSKSGESLGCVISGAQQADPKAVSTYFMDNVLQLLNPNMIKLAILALLEIIKQDDSLDSDTIIDAIGNKKRNQLLTQREFVSSDFLASIFLYVAVSVNNKLGKETAEAVDKQFIDKLKGQSADIILVSQSTDLTAASGSASDTDCVTDPEKIRQSGGQQMQLVYNAPVALEAFTDREEKIREIGDQLDKSGWAMVSGMGGIGKTELVKEYIHRNQMKYKNVCFLNYDGSLMSTIASLPIQGYGGGAENQEDAYKAKLEIMMSRYKEDTLIVIDNFNYTKDGSDDDASAVLDEKFDDVCKGRFHIIFTSRVTNDDCIELSELDSAHQIELFSKYYPKQMSEDDRQAINGILKIIDGHTMTLVLIAKTLSCGRVTPQKMLEKLSADLKTDIPEKVFFKKDDRVRYSVMYSHVESLFDISRLSESERYILMNMTLTPRFGLKSETFKQWAGLKDYNDFNGLENTGWITLDKEPDIASLHPVISDVLANTLKPDSLNCARYLASLNGYLLNLDNGNDSLTLSQAVGFCTSVLKRIQDKTLSMGRISANLGRIYRLTGAFKESLKHVLNALSIYEAEDPQNIDQNELAEMYRQVGLSYSELGKASKEIECYKTAKELFETAAKPDYLNYARTLNLLGSYNRTQAFYPEALKYHQAALQIQQEHPCQDQDKSQLELASTYNYLGRYYNSQSDYGKSLPKFFKSLEIRQSLLSANHRDIAVSLNNIAWVYSKTGHRKEALKYYKEDLEIKQNILPENHPEIALAYYNIGVAYEKNKELDNAWEYFNKALRIRQALDMEDTFKTAAVYRGLCSICRKQKQFDEALVWINKSIEIYERSDRTEDCSADESYINKGYIYRDMERYDEAIDQYRIALDIRRKIFGDFHSKTSNSYRNLADIYLKKKQYDLAIDFYQKALNIRLAIFHENHPKILSIYKNLVLAYQKSGQDNKANEYRKKIENAQDMSGDSEEEE